MKKKVILLTALLIVLLVPSIFLNTQQGVSLSDMFFVRKSTDLYRANAQNSIGIRHPESKTAFDLCLNGETSSATLTWGEPILWPHEDISRQPEHYADTARIEFSDGTVVEGRWNGKNLTDPDGAPLWFNEGASITFGDEPVPIGRYPLADTLCALAANQTEPRGFAAIPFLGALLYITASLHLLFPEQMHFLFRRWQYRSAELSDDGILAERIGAIVLFLLTPFILYLPLFI